MNPIGEVHLKEEEVGGKAFHLNRLAAKFNVPKAYVITGELSEEDLREILARLSERVAVRSSAIGEDGIDCSFAGMHDTFLNIPNSLEDVQKALKKCQDSIHSEWALKYRLRSVPYYIEHESNLITLPQRMPVVIQDMVFPIVAGVCFTCHPVTNNPNHIVLEAVKGLGEDLVSGKVTPDQYIFQREENNEFTIIEESLSPQSIESSSKVIEDHIAKKIVQLALQVERESDAIPQDIEFAYDGEQVWLLQSRPITTIKNTKKKGDLLSNRTTREVIPHPMTLMSWSAFFDVIQHGLQMRYKNRGVDYFAICERESRGFYELRRGYLYQNLTVTDQLSRLEFGVGYKDTLLKTFDEIPLELFETCCEKSSVSLSTQFSGGVGLLNYLSKSTGTIHKTYELLTLYRKKFESFESWKLLAETKELKSMYEEFLCLQNEFSEFGGVYIESQIYLELFSSIVRMIIGKYCGSFKERADSCFNELIVGLGDIITHEMNVKLCELQTVAHSEGLVLDFINEALSNENATNRWENWREHLAGTKTYELLDAFLLSFGHRAVCELEVSSPRWGNDPSYIFDVISITSEKRTQKDLTIAKKTRQQLEMTLLQQCSYLMRPVLKWTLSRLQEFIRFRENLKDIVIRFISKQQQLLIAIEKQWELKNLFSCFNGCIFHCSVQQLKLLVNGNLSFDSLKALVKQNRLLHEEFSSIHVSPKIYIDNEKKKAVDTADGIYVGDRVQYNGKAGAPGQISGQAVILNSLKDVQLLSRCQFNSKVLITRVTDPAWTPLFLKVDAVVVETGGILSHAAIVAREFGIPCVFGIPKLLSIVSHGDTITVDGDSGYILLLR